MSKAVDRHGNLKSSEVEVGAAFRRLMGPRETRVSATATAAEMIGPLTPGVEITGLTNGQYSMIDMLEHVLDEAGPSDVCVATWTMGIYDAARAYEFTTNGKIRSIRFLVDASMFTRRPELSGVLVRAFGENAFRAVTSHAKFATVRSDTMAVAIRSSMNLNRNDRLESFDIAVCPDLTAFFERQIDAAFAAVDVKSRSQSRAVFASVLSAKPISSSKIRNPFAGAV